MMLPRSLLRAPARLISRTYATAPSAPPPMMLKIRSDMKKAMQAKDTARLAVLRSVLASTLNASKTASPINTDMQMLALLRKTAAASRAAKEDFERNGRADLADKEGAQLAIMEEYAGGVEVVSEEEIREVVGKLVEGMSADGQVKMGEVLKRAFAPEGGLAGKNVERGDVAKVVKEMLAKA